MHSMVIAKTTSRSRSVATKAGKMSEAILDTQASFGTPEVREQDVLSERESLDDNDVECNADLHILKPCFTYFYFLY